MSVCCFFLSLWLKFDFVRTITNLILREHTSAHTAHPVQLGTCPGPRKAAVSLQVLQQSQVHGFPHKTVVVFAPHVESVEDAPVPALRTPSDHAVCQMRDGTKHRSPEGYNSSMPTPRKGVPQRWYLFHPRPQAPTRIAKIFKRRLQCHAHVSGPLRLLSDQSPKFLVTGYLPAPRPGARVESQIMCSVYAGK